MAAKTARPRIPPFLKPARVVVAVLVLVSGVWLTSCGTEPVAEKVAVEPGARADREADELLRTHGPSSGSIVPNTARHAATSEDGTRTLDLYTYKGSFTGGPIEQCWYTNEMDRVTGSGGGGAGCQPIGANQPAIGGGISTGSGTVPAHTMEVAYASPDTTLVVVDLASGRRLEAPVLDGFSIIGWTGPMTETALVIELRDADGEVLYRETRPPSTGMLPGG